MLIVFRLFPTTGYSVFVVGVADVDMSELRVIGSKPSERHVFVVDDYDAFAKIQDNLITFICETATSSKAEINAALKHSCNYHCLRFQRETLDYCNLSDGWSSAHLQRLQEALIEHISTDLLPEEM